ncbi:MAG: oxidoreductase [Thermoleophilia bacterium]|nr:oxidoreductase [Thermoleophilia bacterium]
MLVTGAGAGLGRELARQLGAAGCHLALLDADAAALGDAATDATAAGAASVLELVCDISDLDQVEAASAQLEREVGHLDVLVNNAGIFTDDEIERREPARRRTAFLVNALGPIQVTTAALPLLRRSQRNPHVLNVISASGFSDTESADNRRWSTYGATKAALAGYNTTLTRQLAPEGIRVSGIFPGGFESDLYERAGTVEEHHDAAWMMRTQDVAEIILFVLTRPPDVNIERLLVTKQM